MPHGPEWKKVMLLLQVPPKRTHNYDCQSIDRARRKRHTNMATRPSRIDRLVKSLNKLTENERNILLHSLLEMQ